MSTSARGGFFGALGSLLKTKENFVVRPPYANEGETFEVCTTCDAPCVNSCDEKILHIDGARRPFLEFSSTGCSDCHQCLEACVPNVLVDSMRFISGHAKIAMSSCMSHHQTVCFSCKEPCLEDAIVFSGMFNPIILGEKCTGCGYCISVCPSGAIEMVA